MKIAFAMLCLFGIMISGGCGIWHFWWYPATYEAPLKLADDASLPDSKAEYLREYLKAVDSIEGPPRYIFKRPDLNLAKQKIILQGLITRFDDIGKLEPSSMAYQQGMFQLTGQEMDNQLKRISKIFEDARIRESPLLYVMFWMLSWSIWVGAIILGLILLES